MFTSVNDSADGRDSVAASINPIPFPRRLFVPLVPSPGEQAKVAAAGARVRRGESLVTSPIVELPLPIAPADGTIAGTVAVALAGGDVRNAVVLETDPDQSPDHQREPLDVQAALSATHGIGLLECVERLCRGGVWADRWTSPDLLGQLRQALA